MTMVRMSKRCLTVPYCEPLTEDCPQNSRRRVLLIMVWCHQVMTKVVWRHAYSMAETGFLFYFLFVILAVALVYSVESVNQCCERVVVGAVLSCSIVSWADRRDSENVWLLLFCCCKSTSRIILRVLAWERSVYLLSWYLYKASHS